MSNHFLIINHESYDSSTVFGIFGTFNEARDYIEAKAAEREGRWAEDYAEIEEWDGDKHIRTHEREYTAPKAWKADA